MAASSRGERHTRLGGPLINSRGALKAFPVVTGLSRPGSHQGANRGSAGQGPQPGTARASAHHSLTGPRTPELEPSLVWCPQPLSTSPLWLAKPGGWCLARAEQIGHGGAHPPDLPRTTFWKPVEWDPPRELSPGSRVTPSPGATPRPRPSSPDWGPPRGRLPSSHPGPLRPQREEGDGADQRLSGQAPKGEGASPQAEHRWMGSGAGVRVGGKGTKASDTHRAATGSGPLLTGSETTDL